MIVAMPLLVVMQVLSDTFPGPGRRGNFLGGERPLLLASDAPLDGQRQPVLVQDDAVGQN